MENYEILSSLEVRHFDTVYKGKDKRNNSYVSIKKVNMQLYPDMPKPTKLSVILPNQVIRELKLVTNLQHPNIVSLFETVVETDDTKQIYIISEYLDTTLLKYLQLLPRNLPMDPLLIKYYLYQINNALIFCKANNVVHHDVRPSNLLISSNGVIKLGDFCHARSFEEPSVSLFTTCIENATLWYRPPEVLLELTCSFPVDVWSLGCVFAEMVTKTVLFQPTQNEILQQLTEIFKVLTSPTVETWPGVAALEHFNKVQKFDDDDDCLQEKVPQLDECGLALLRAMLMCDPDKRISSKEIAQHPFFRRCRFKRVKPDFGNFDLSQG